MLYKSALTTAASGSIDGMTASHNRGGRYFRARSIPTDPATSFQLTMRQALLSLSTRYTEILTNAQREAWTIYAADTPVVNPLGDLIILSGQQMYLRCQTPRYQALMFTRPAGTAYTPPTITIADDAPTTPGAEDVGFLALDAAEAGAGYRTSTTSLANATIGWDEGSGATWMGQDEAILLVYLSRSQPQAKNYFRGPYGFAGFVQGAAIEPTSPSSIEAPFPMIEGQRVYWRAQVSASTNKLSNVFEGWLTIVPAP